MAVNATNGTTLLSKNVKMYVTTVFNGFRRTGNAGRQLYQSSRTSVNIIRGWTRTLISVRITATVQSPFMTGVIMSVLRLDAQLSANVGKYLITWQESAFRKVISVLRGFSTIPHQQNARFSVSKVWSITGTGKHVKCQQSLYLPRQKPAHLIKFSTSKQTNASNVAQTLYSSTTQSQADAIANQATTWTHQPWNACKTKFFVTHPYTWPLTKPKTVASAHKALPLTHKTPALLFALQLKTNTTTRQLKPAVVFKGIH